MKKILVTLLALGFASAAWAVTERFDSLDMNSNAITDLPAPSATTDAVRKSYVEGKNVIYIPAGAMRGNVTSPASCGDMYDTGSNDMTTYVCAFDTGATEERADFQIFMPKSWDESTLTYQAIWSNQSGASAQTVQWEVGCAAISDDDTLNVTMGSTVLLSDTWLAQNDLHVTAESGALTCGGTPAEGDLLTFRISRDTSVDNMAGDALLIGLKIFWTSNVHNEP